MEATLSPTTGYTSILNKGLRLFFSEFVRVSLRHPAQAFHFLRVVGRQRGAARVRGRHAAAGLHVPPIAIFSITNRCNLKCKGCYAQAIRGDAPDALSEAQVRSIISQATEIGISFFVIAGGEPLMRPEFLSIARDFPKALFLLATNGTLPARPPHASDSFGGRDASARVRCVAPRTGLSARRRSLPRASRVVAAQAHAAKARGCDTHGDRSGRVRARST
jgi:uncharacterized Fe-S cluster-containing radical SAM superfamily protein